MKILENSDVLQVFFLTFLYRMKIVKRYVNLDTINNLNLYISLTNLIVGAEHSEFKLIDLESNITYIFV